MKKSQIRMPLWGPYSKKYMGLSRIVDDRAAEGARYDFVVHPTLWNSATPVPNVTVPSGYHLWSCDEDFRFYSYRYELMWKDQIYADVSYTRLDEESYLMRCRFVNDTDLSQNCILNIFGALEFPAPEHCALQLPGDAALVDANDYTQYTYAKPRPWDNENPDGMHKGEFADGEKVLRAKIDMAHPNMLFRDPIMYRILHAEHHRTGNKWCIYPMYDYAHGQCDSIERITHSICTLEFDVHRPLYDWFIQALDIYPSHQYEFARLNLTYTMMSKRRLLKLVQEGAVMGWDDPRMPTICALRRKGYTPASVRNFAEMVGVAKRDNVIDLGKLEFCVREDLNKVAERRMAVLNPLKVVITAGGPQLITLSDYLVYLPRGSAFDASGYIQSVTAPDGTALSAGQVSIESPVDTSVPGTYHVGYSVTAQGQSYTVYLAVVVE